EEDIVKIEAWIKQPGNYLWFTITFAALTPPAGQSIYIILTMLDGSTETVINYWIYGAGGADTTFNMGGTELPSVDTPVAWYAWLGPPPGTDRAPNDGFYSVTSLSQQTPNVFQDPEEPAAPVGGVVIPTSKLEILAPFAALAGLIVAVSAVVVVKRRRD
ncbi:hypothetical protein MUP59_10155, partial [Candidatus Bathyarchaeota archaeon]|nr:hypothetical protein [Candidatus Bathyarchaeota archaeon]